MDIQPTGSKVVVMFSERPVEDPESDGMHDDSVMRGTVKGIGPDYAKKSGGKDGGMAPCCSHYPISVGDEVICRCRSSEMFDNDGELLAFIHPDQIDGVVGGKSAKKLSKLVGEKGKESKSSVAEPDEDDGYSEETEMDE